MYGIRGFISSGMKELLTKCGGVARIKSRLERKRLCLIVDEYAHVSGALNEIDRAKLRTIVQSILGDTDRLI